MGSVNNPRQQFPWLNNTACFMSLPSQYETSLITEVEKERIEFPLHILILEVTLITYIHNLLSKAQHMPSPTLRGLENKSFSCFQK